MPDEFDTPRQRKEAYPTLEDYCRSRDLDGLAELIWSSNAQKSVFGTYSGSVGTHSKAVLRVAAEMKL